jgi:hypothetical protein
MRRWWFMALMVALSATSAFAQPFLTLSDGIKSCGAFVSAGPQEKEMFLGWALGFISGANSLASGRDRSAGFGWNREAAVGFLESYCSANPEQPFGVAVIALRNSLPRDELRPPVTDGNGPTL